MAQVRADLAEGPEEMISAILCVEMERKDIATRLRRPDAP